MESAPDSLWDRVVLGDVIEHLPKSKGIDLIHRLSYMASNIIVVYIRMVIVRALSRVRNPSVISPGGPLRFRIRDGLLPSR